MTNIILLLACSLCGFAIGKYLEKRIKRKGEFYNDLTRYVALMKINIKGRKVELAKFNAEFAVGSSKVFADYVIDGELKCALKQSQKNNVTQFFENMSCATSDALEKHIEYYAEIFATDAKDITKEVASVSIYSKLGLLLGMIVGILLL